MAGIKDSSLNVVKCQILANPEARNSFDRAVTLYKDYIVQNRDNTATASFQIAAVHTAAPTDSDEVEDRYYTAIEYRQLPKKQKEKLHKLRSNRKGKRKYSNSEGHSSYRPPHKKQLKQQIASIVADILDARDNGSVATRDEATGSSTGSNRNHPALTRQSGLPKRK